ncbi:DNA (cytosine-5-)-methyltransferase, partial [Planktothrix sp. FACHB-1355]
IALAVEKDPHTAAQYRENFPNTPVLCADVTQLTGQEILSSIGYSSVAIDLVVGGPSCQGFSRIGKRDPKDSRNSGVYHFVRLVGELQPRAFLMENVASMRDSRYAELIDNCWQQLKSYGYQIREWKLNASNYGVPQSRERLFWVGCRDAATKAPAPLEQPVTVYDAFSDLLPLEGLLALDKDIIETDWQPGEYSQYLNIIFTPQGNWNPQRLTGCTLTDHSPEVIERFITAPTGEIEPISRLYRLDYQRQCTTLRAGTATAQGGHTAPRPIHPEHPRVITVREAARLSSFPDWFQFHPTKWRGHRQIGNAVPPLLARAVGIQLIDALSNTQSFSPDQTNTTKTTGSTTMTSTTIISNLDNYNFPPLTSSKTIKLAKEIVELGSTHAASLGKIKEASLELGYKLLELENAVGQSEVKEILKHCFPKEIVRYLRNLLCQAKLIEKCPSLYSRILSMPICHTAILLAGTEEQIEQILTSDTKWTVELLKLRLKADNHQDTTLPIPLLAINAPVKIIADVPDSGEIARVENIDDDRVTVTKLHTGEVSKFDINEVKPLCQDTYTALTTILATTASLHTAFKDAADTGDQRLQNDIENKLNLLDKSRRQLTARLAITEKAAKNLASYVAANTSIDPIATQDECASTFRVWNIGEDDREPIIAKAQLLAKLRTKQIFAQPTLAELAIATATILHKPTTKNAGGGIPISTREYSELTELVQEKDSTIQQLKAELDEVKANRQTVVETPDNTISSRLDVMQQEMESLRTAYQSIEQKYSNALTELESYKQLTQKQASEINALKNSNTSVQTTDNTSTAQTFQPNDIVRIIANSNQALVNQMGIFREVEIEELPLGTRERAVVVLSPGTRFQIPVRIANYQQSLEKLAITKEEFLVFAQAEDLVEQNKDLESRIEHKESKIDEAVCQIGRCLAQLGIPGWYEKGVYIDSQGRTHSDAIALEEGVKTIAEILVNLETQVSYSEQSDEDIEF